MEKIITMSENGKSEYCCSVVRVGELIPIEGSDFLAKTNVLGTQIVVRKDLVHEGDIMFYSANETELNHKFLSINNLYEIGCRDMNSNADEVNKIMKEYDENYRNIANELKAKAKNIKGNIDKATKDIQKLNKKILKIENNNEEKERINKIIDSKTSTTLKLTVEYTNLKNEIESINKSGEHIVNEAKKLCGFFNKYGRVRCITLKGTPSFGFLFGVDSMIKYCPEIKNVNLEEYINQDFDTVNGELFVKAYVPRVKECNIKRSKSEKRNNKLNRFDRLIAGEFSFHYDTAQLQKNMHCIKPDDILTITNKIHGTSCIFGKLLVREKKHIPFYKSLWNKFVDATNLFKSTRFIDYKNIYGPIYSSRTVIKNRYINESVDGGFYGQDIWSEWGDIMYPYLSEGMTIYGEIFGYLTGSEKMIQKHYDYGCEVGENKLMIYRITSTTPQGKKFEWNVQEVQEWTKRIIRLMKESGDENYKRLHPIDILYHGTLESLYPDIDTENHWQENVLEQMKNDKKNFGMEDYEPLCTHNEVPREGIVVRIDNDLVAEAFKLKTVSFALGEAVLYDDENYVDIEVSEGNY